MNAPATETCTRCGGGGMDPEHAGYCGECHGHGRIPVPLRSTLTDAADDETERLKRKIEVARKALEAIRATVTDCEHGDDCPRTGDCDEADEQGEGCLWCGEDDCPECQCTVSDIRLRAWTALKELSK